MSDDYAEVDAEESTLVVAVIGDDETDPDGPYSTDHPMVLAIGIPASIIDGELIMAFRTVSEAAAAYRAIGDAIERTDRLWNPAMNEVDRYVLTVFDNDRTRIEPRIWAPVDEETMRVVDGPKPEENA